MRDKQQTNQQIHEIKGMGFLEDVRKNFRDQYLCVFLGRKFSKGVFLFCCACVFFPPFSPFFFISCLKGRGIFEIQVPFAEHKSSKLDWLPSVGEGRVGTGEGTSGRIALCSLHSVCLPSQDLQHVLSCTEYFVCRKRTRQGVVREGVVE